MLPSIFTLCLTNSSKQFSSLFVNLKVSILKTACSWDVRLQNILTSHIDCLPSAYEP